MRQKRPEIHPFLITSSGATGATEVVIDGVIPPPSWFPPKRNPRSPVPPRTGLLFCLLWNGMRAAISDATFRAQMSHPELVLSS